jgi:hypothetical protein
MSVRPVTTEKLVLKNNATTTQNSEPVTFTFNATQRPEVSGKNSLGISTSGDGVPWYTYFSEMEQKSIAKRVFLQQLLA